ncbi:hypothetical protein [Flammeovirga pacifica]|uniref:Uncharacterized protein n=1 Tax=Flammeovirga pacifica TaxID=915059 RepID=A0A1S1YYE2_FLAPC|nr:hypothetical protein [Flammeovirga pacifica]OHX66034.1 hypothetical protein NH26_06555 [Flammeovirga pacifica]
MKINKIWKYFFLISLAFAFISCDEESGGDDDINPEDFTYLYFTTGGDLTEITIQHDSLPDGGKTIQLDEPINIQVKFDPEAKMMYLSTKVMYYSDSEPSPAPDPRDSVRRAMDGEGMLYFEESSVELATTTQGDDFSWSFTADSTGMSKYTVYDASTCELDEEGDGAIGEMIAADDFFMWDEDAKNYYMSLRKLAMLMGDDDDGPDSPPVDGMRFFMDSTGGDNETLPEYIDIRLWAKSGDLTGCEENN